MSENSQAKGPVSDETLESRLEAAPKRQSAGAENLSGKNTGRVV
jgi:hypothetical protein